jgi:DNA polymerase-3 subunit delta
MPVYLYWGEEDYNIEREVKNLKNSILDENWSSINQKKLIEPEIRLLNETIGSTPMMFGNMLFEIYSNSLFLRGSSKAEDETYKKSLLNILETLGDNIHVLFICKIPGGSGKKADSVSKIYKLISKIGKIQEFPAFKSYQEDKIINWVKSRAGDKNVNFSADACIAFVQNNGEDLRKLDNELDKLILYIHPDKIIKKNDVLELCSNQENIFLIADYLLKNQKQKAINELYKVLEKEHALKIIAILHTTLRKWIKLKLESATKSHYEISKIINLHEFVVKKELEKLKNVSLASLIKLSKDITEAEYRIKTGAMTPEMSLESVIAAQIL